jgi:hypothetical protein
MQEAGADAVLEMAFTIADGLEYCRTGNFFFAVCIYTLFVQCIVPRSPRSRLKLKKSNYLFRSNSMYSQQIHLFEDVCSALLNSFEMNLVLKKLGQNTSI